MFGMFLGTLVFSSVAFNSLKLLYKFIIVQVADEFVSRRDETEWLADAHSHCHVCSSGFKTKLRREFIIDMF